MYTHSPADQQTADSRACCRMCVTWLIWPYAVDQRAVGGARVFGQCGFVYVAALQLAIAVVMCSVRNARCHAALDDIDIGVHNVVEPGLSCAFHACFVCIQASSYAAPRSPSSAQATAQQSLCRS